MGYKGLEGYAEAAKYAVDRASSGVPSSRTSEGPPVYRTGGPVSGSDMRFVVAIVQRILRDAGQAVAVTGVWDLPTERAFPAVFGMGGGRFARALTASQYTENRGF